MRPAAIGEAREAAPAKLIGSLLPSRHHLVCGNPTPQCLTGITEAAERGKFVPAIGRTAPLSEAISAVVEPETTGLPKDPQSRRIFRSMLGSPAPKRPRVGSPGANDANRVLAGQGS